MLTGSSVFAQRNHGGGNGGVGSFNHGGGNSPSTFITRVSTTPVTTAGSGDPPTSSPAQGSSSANPSPAGASSVASSGSVDTSLIPPFGITAGVKANDGTANCVGDGGKAIPCDCPPDSNTFVSALEDSVAAGAAFPPGTSAADQLTRLQTCIVTLQNFRGGAGSGVGCPIVSTTWKELQAQLQSETK
ncbi:hypothetical protein A1O1_05667 [Capronia coronata CBS 617.96]|uniref:Uncharacterized protein n=1 Tax=Capronia coronata CBS 617.96 TaxID=1182541 RepID=W9YGD0_9EURO|nr:uncharacterized protein A1O1_05667 [Capronia coronata CBS 617.96]EXJ88735.1 hypothetical protein A1O1_05667 [Capronia coronata CBS 617.96]